MFKLLWVFAFSVMIAAPLSAASMEGRTTYDLLFRNGTLDHVERDNALIYRRAVENTLIPEADDRDTGEVALTLGSEDAPMAMLEFRQGEKQRSLGQFPVSVGNPMIMYFYETVVRDMAEAAGGSPFYIRNRVKEALVQPSEVIEGLATIDGQEVPTVTVRLTPFADDPNRDRMQGFGDLELRVTMSEAVPGWYLSLVADTAADGAAGVYRSSLEFDRLEPGE